MARTRRHEWGVGVLLLVATVLLAWMAVQVGAVGSLSPKVHVDLRIGHAAGVQAGAVVAVAGVPVGKVTSLSIDHDAAVARLALEASAGLRRDVRARVRARSLLGEKYIELAPQSRDAALLVTDDVLQVAVEQVEIDEMVQELGPLLQSFDGPGLAEALTALTSGLAEDPQRLGRMLDHADTLLAQGAAVSQELPALLAHADATLGRVDAAVVLLERRLQEVGTPVRKANEVLDDLGRAVEPLDAVVREAHAAVVDARGAVHKADDLLGGMDGIDDDLRALLANLQGFDKWEIRRLLREEGILIRVRPKEVVPSEP